jgi:TusA-related sulfurtransferase
LRARASQIPIGDSLGLIARDPATKEDLPPLARLLGNRVVSVRTPDDGRL